jgi:hypothetical protein
MFFASELYHTTQKIVNSQKPPRKCPWRKALSHVVADAYDLTPYTRFGCSDSGHKTE